MSGLNGDKSRFNRRRKQNIDRRARQRVMLGSQFKPAESTVAGSQGSPATKAKEKSA